MYYIKVKKKKRLKNSVELILAQKKSEKQTKIQHHHSRLQAFGSPIGKQQQQEQQRCADRHKHIGVNETNLSLKSALRTSGSHNVVVG